MAQFSVNPAALRPVQELQIPGQVGRPLRRRRLQCEGLKRTTDLVEHREGGDPSTTRKSPGRTKFEAITLERGVTHDTEFEKWANKVWNFGSGLGAEVSLKDFRKDIIIEVYNEAGQLALAYKVFRCWVSEYQALPDLDANANAAIAIQNIKLENEGWERDLDVTEPAEPSFRRRPDLMRPLERTRCAGAMGAGSRAPRDRPGAAALRRRAPELPADRLADLPLGSATRRCSDCAVAPSDPRSAPMSIVRAAASAWSWRCRWTCFCRRRPRRR